jgi:hypothetical protein
MSRVPGLFLLPAIAAATAIVAGCSSGSGGNSATEAEQAMYAAVSKPVMTAVSAPPAGHKMVGTAADGLRLAVPDGWVPVHGAAFERALHDLGLSRAAARQLQAVVPGRGAPDSLDVATPGTGGVAALTSLYCVPAGFPAGTSPATGLTTLSEQEFTAADAGNTQLGQTTVDGRTALLSYDQASIGGRSLTVLQYAIAAPAGRACYTTLVTEQGSSYEPAFSQLRPGIQVLAPTPSS